MSESHVETRPDHGPETQKVEDAMATGPERRTQHRKWVIGECLGILGLLAALQAWLWPLGLGGRMPVRGDVTQFFLGVMGFYGDALKAGRLPLWNDLWGLGFPGLAESQMGVYYPIHWAVYGLLSPEWGYLTSLLVHTAWGALGVVWAGRQFGLGRVASYAAGFVSSTSGFFLIHLSHQWSYTVGSWLPWALGLTWTVLEHRGGARSALLLAGVLGIQILPGHFQLAFMTQVSVLTLAVWTCFDGGDRGDLRSRLRLSGLVVMAWLASVPLSFAQIWPTWHLAQLAESQRDPLYLSAFAASPLHLISYIAPELFQVSPLWRPLVWDPFRTAPEEHMGYVGLIPLALALGTAIGRFRTDRNVRALSLLALLSLALSLGPWVPGFSWYCQLPGFSFFRAPARWGLVTAWSLAMLAGLGLDHWQMRRERPPSLKHGPDRSGHPLWLTGLLAVMAIGLTLLLIESALWARLPSAPNWLGSGFRQAWTQLEVGDVRDFDSVVGDADRPLLETRAQAKLAQNGVTEFSNQRLRFVPNRFAIYLRELTPTLILASLSIVLGLLAGRIRIPRAVLMVIVLADSLWMIQHHRPFDTTTAGPLTSQSPTLAKLDDLPRGTRLVSTAQNLPMLIGKGTTVAYRTIDLPIQPELTARLYGSLADPRTDPRLIANALRTFGTEVLVIDPIEVQRLREQPRRLESLGDDLTLLDDPASASWIHSEAFVRVNAPRLDTIGLWTPDQDPPRAWFLRDDLIGSTPLEDRTGDPDRLLADLDRGRPLALETIVPERTRIAFETDRPGQVVWASLYHPHWRGELRGGEGATEPAEVTRVYDGWTGLRVPGPGSWTVTFRYVSPPAAIGRWVSGIAWLGWFAALVVATRRPK